MTENKRFRVTIGNENDVSFVDYIDNTQLLAISFKDYKDAVDCRDALMYQCNLMNELHDKIDRFEFILQEAIRTERTDMGKSVLMQLADNIGVEY